MRRLVLAAVVCALLSVFSCTKADQPVETHPAATLPANAESIPRSAQPPAPQAQPSWFIESYDNGVIIARHDGNVYRATCVETSSYLKGFIDVTRSPKCSLSIELVGHDIKALDAQVNSDTDGPTIVVLNVGERLVFRMRQGEGSGIRDEEFKVNSVTRGPH